jgi:hypothetical protein
MADPDHLRSSLFRGLFESALQAYESKVVVTLAEQPLAIQLQSCDSVESITAVLQGQVNAFTEFRGSDRAMKSIKDIVSILTRLSDTSSLATDIDLVRHQMLMACFSTLTVFIAIPTHESNICWSRYPTCCMFFL